MASFNLAPAPRIYPDRVVHIAFLPTKKVKIPDKYSDFANVFSKEKTLVLPECNKLNKYAINLKNDKQLLYKPIYNLDLMGLETLKTYIKTYLKTGFI